MNYNISNQSHLKWIAQTKRMLLYLRILDYYHNRYLSHIHKKLKITFPNNYTVLRGFVRKFPLLKTLSDDISLLFKTSPTITSDNDVLNDYVNNSNLWALLPTINRLANTVYKIGILPRIYNGKINYTIITPDSCWVLTNNLFPTLILALYYITDTSNTLNAMPVNIATKITNDFILSVLIGSNGISKILKQLSNPYGYIPVVWILTLHAYDSFWPTISNPLALLNEYYVIHKTYLAFALAYQAIATMVTKGLDPKAVIPFGPSSWINLPTTAMGLSDAKYITPGTDFLSLFAYSRDILLQATAYVGISADSYRQSSQYSSGYALLLSKINVIDFNTLQIPIYVLALTKLLQMTADTINIYTLFLIPNNILYNVDIKLPLTMISYALKLDNWKKLILIGITNIKTILLLKYPLWTDDMLLLFLNSVNLEKPDTIIL